ncbi:hypothetical protein THAOC_10174 [Thalassiosira oceanica]|uniref:Uncharacterized protein n=1 Tax=Thalassiosira oceanica TaxID=159749 RepID=K0TDK9_THAOC|nr:hypothetical protein THAOC_10174 [Thalassiosira oceanica]|eukprot:EJK68627.1 hypothetical protein THAOC_10174 [Thalassiosira oceanica]
MRERVFQKGPLASAFVFDRISNYDTNKTRLDEAPFGRADDDNGPGSEPPPHDHKRYVSTFITGRRRSPAAVGKPSFPRFKVYYLPRRSVQVRAETVGLALREGDLHDATAYGGTEGICNNLRNPRNDAIRLASA